MATRNCKAVFAKIQYVHASLMTSKMVLATSNLPEVGNEAVLTPPSPQNIAGFKTIDETEIPQLQAHCEKLTETGRSANCKVFINKLSQYLNSLTLWASSDGPGANLTTEQRAREAGYLQKGLETLESVSIGPLIPCISRTSFALFCLRPSRLSLEVGDCASKCVYYRRR